MTFEPSYANITSTIAAIAGITGAAVATRVYRFTKEVKTSDVRVQFRKELIEYRLIVEALPSRIEEVAQSHQRVIVILQSAGGNLQRWIEEQTKDLAEARTLEMGLPNPAATYHNLDLQELENKRVALHGQRFKADQLRSKYEAIFAADERKRERIMATHEARAIAMIGSGIRG
jgi:hypothetical protein